MTIEARLAQFVSAELLDGSQTVEPADRLLAEGLVDSLGMMRLVGFIGDTYRVEVPPQDIVLANFSTIERIATYLRERGIG